MGDQPPPTHADAGDKIPGDVGIWVFVLGDMSVFSVLFCLYLYYRGQQPLLYAAAQASLSTGFGLVDTVTLLTSSWCVAQAVHALHRQFTARARRFLLFGIGCGALFVCCKLLEYALKLNAGITPATSEFYSFYYVLTGLHFVHTVIGMIVLAFMARASRTPGQSTLIAIDSGATYWHMVDVLWIMIFTLLYLLR